MGLNRKRNAQDELFSVWTHSRHPYLRSAVMRAFQQANASSKNFKGVYPCGSSRASPRASPRNAFGIRLQSGLNERSPPQRDLCNTLFWWSAPQRIPRLIETRISQVTQGCGTPEVPEMLEKCSSCNSGCLGNVGNRDRGGEIGRHIIDSTPQIARSDCSFATSQKLSVIIGMREEQPEHNELLEQADGDPIICTDASWVVANLLSEPQHPREKLEIK